MPKKPRDPRDSPGQHILQSADIGRKAAASRADGTRAKCEAAMREIEAAIDANGGVYPYDNGKISLQTVLRTAKLSGSVLEKKEIHGKTKAKIRAWLEGIGRRVVRKSASVRKLVTEPLEAAKDEVREIMSVWHEAELEFQENRIVMAQLAEENALLKNEVARLRVELAGENVVAMRMKRE